MLSYNDCVALSELTPEEIVAIACRLHVPEIVAVQMGVCLLQTPNGAGASAAALQVRATRRGPRGLDRDQAVPGRAGLNSSVR